MTLAPFAVGGPGFRGRFLGAAVLALVWVFAPSNAHADDHAPNLAPGPASAKGFPISFGGPFTLVDHRGRERTDKDFKGRYLLVYFGYTFCPNICPTGLQTLSSALDLLGEEAAKVQPLFISVDPERDKPEILKSFVAQFHPRLIGLTGSEKQVRNVARAYRIFRGKVIIPDEPEDEYLVTHTPTTFLMGPDGKFVTLFPHDTDAEVMAKALKRTLAGSGRS
ncbi:MAG: SCO family protein [Proteobacteria bacterium]|nr:SCO family protein [Pseudomonadota bacterium]MCH7831620.1 SCO family protein [Pseudomonadota bacterium]